MSGMDGGGLRGSPFLETPLFGKDAVNEHFNHRLAHRVGMLSLALLLIGVSAGLGYVTHLTQMTSQATGGSSPSLLPLIALSIVAALSGIGMLRYAWHAEPEKI